MVKNTLTNLMTDLQKFYCICENFLANCALVTLLHIMHTLLNAKVSITINYTVYLETQFLKGSA